MSWVWKGIPIPTLVALVLLVVGGLLHIVGVATPYWHVETLTNAAVKNFKNAHYGLWAGCRLSGIETFECTAHSEVNGFITATRAFMILALLCGAVCIIVTGLWYFLNLTKYNLICMIASLGSGFLAGLMGIVGIIVYGAEFKNSETIQTLIIQRVDNTLSWSFALCTLSSCLAVIATVLIGLGTRMRQ